MSATCFKSPSPLPYRGFPWTSLRDLRRQTLWVIAPNENSWRCATDDFTSKLESLATGIRPADGPQKVKNPDDII